MLRLSLLALLLMALGVGCGQQIAMADDVEFELHFYLPFTGPSNALHTPYVAGASMNLYAVSSDDHQDMTGWHFRSSNPAVFSVGSTTSGAPMPVPCTAVAAGSAEVTLLDTSNHVLASEDVSVAVPDAAVVEAHGPLMLGQGDSAATVTAPEILAGGTATFLVRWYAHGVELSGSGTLTTQPSAGLTATPEATEFLIHRDWVEITAPSTPGPAAVVLMANGVAVTTLPITVMDPSAIDHIHLAGLSESNVTTGTWLLVIADASDASGAAIYGVTYSFDLDGTPQEGAGDVYRYQYNPTMPRMLTATTGSQSASVMIHSSSGHVDSTNNIGCDVCRPGTQSGTGRVAAGCMALGVAFARRRRMRFG